LASGASAAKKIDYPKLDLHGAGSLSCNGKRYDTIAKYRVDLDVSLVHLDFYEGRVVNAGSTVEDRANPKIAQSLGLTTYKRPTKDERAALVSGGFIWAPYVLFAKSALKSKQGHNFEISPPLPFFPLPAKPSRYDDLKSGSKSWTSQVTGGPEGPFTATVTVSLGGQVDDEVTLLFSMNITQDTDRRYYEAFPVPKEATYVVNTKTLDIRRITATNWYRGDSACDSRPEDIRINYELCQKTTGSKDERYSCSN
jgi:hypothetical protein